ncbi:hypothetical protein LIER_04632 [Lithospermum erythrorhizon]|uniref:Viral late gene transcription factor 3 zinc ribbon domain-containing protein n=1 Tax=Lithospermum erythrorhizon TaxID=34254 RepID=A0AAV3NXF4_LITER
MEALSTISPANLNCQFKKILSGNQSRPFRTNSSSISLVRKHHPTSRTRHSTSRISAVSDVPTVISDPAQVEITWEIVLGTLAGVTPFVVAGIEFSKRIVKQRECKACGGSGLVLRDDKYYFRCPRCGMPLFFVLQLFPSACLI